MTLTMAASAHGAESPAGGGALRQAREAWEKGSLTAAEPLYREALERGGLAPNEVLEGYVRLGAIRASVGKKDQAIAAFRAASILDASFAVPSEAGPKGPALAARAKQDTAKIGSIRLTVKAPKEAPSGKSFKVTAQLDPTHVQIVSKLGLIARDGTSGKEATVVDSKAEESVEFVVPSEVTLPSASLLVRVDALDSHNNRLASAEQHVHVPESATGSGVAAAAGSTPAAGRTAAGVGALGGTLPAGDTLRKGGTFWSSPWTYVIGGVALAGAGTALYFVTRPSAEVSVGEIGVRTR